VQYWEEAQEKLYQAYQTSLKELDAAKQALADCLKKAGL